MSFRVTQKQSHRLALNSVLQSRTRLTEAQRVAMSGLRVDNPSDDPAAAARARLISSLLSDSRAHEGNASYAVARLGSADEALAQGTNLLIRAREVATAMANGTMSAQDRLTSASEVQQLRAAMADVINTRFGDEYVFANVNSTQPPVDAVSGAFNYDPDTYDQVRQVELGPRQTSEVGASGAHAFAQRAANASSVDVMNVFDQFITNLQADDPDAIRADIDQIAQALDQIISERASVGVRLQRGRQAGLAAEQSIALYQALRSDLVEADAAEAFTELSFTENALQASVTVASRILGPTLVDLL